MTALTGECAAVRHGTLTAYRRYGCRCPDVRAAWCRYAKRERVRRHRGDAGYRPAVGARRRFRALMANGWPQKELLTRLGWSARCAPWLYRGEHVTVDTHRKVCEIYNDLADLPGPSQWTRSRSLRAGWLPPVHWDSDTIDDPDHDPRSARTTPPGVDWVVVERLVAGIPVRASREERFAAYERMRELRVPAARVQARLRMSGSELAVFARRVEQEKYVGGVLDAAVVDVAS